MGNDHSTFRKIIRLANSETDVAAHGEVAVSIDTKTNRVASKNLLNIFSNNNRNNYIIGTSGTNKHRSQSKSDEFEVIDGQSNQRLAFFYDYTAFCEAGSEVKLAEYISNFNSPEQALNDLLEKGIRQYEQKIGESVLLNDFSSQQMSLCQTLSELVLNEMGLIIKLTPIIKHSADAITLMIVRKEITSK